MPKKLLILKATKDICGNEVQLIQNHVELLGMEAHQEHVESEDSLSAIFKKHADNNNRFDYLYLCTHGNTDEFQVDMGANTDSITWAKFSELICENEILNDDTILLLACCKGGFFRVASDILACCYKINFVCGVKWKVNPWDLTTGFIVFIHNMEVKQAEPSYAAQKASRATDYTFVCYDRDEIETNPQFTYRREILFQELGWTDDSGTWIETDEKIIENVGNIEMNRC